MSEVTITIPKAQLTDDPAAREAITLSGWSGLQVTRGIDTCADGFAFSVPWRPTERNKRIFRAYRPQRVLIKIDGEQVIHGRMESLKPKFSASERSLEIQGRSLTGVLADSSIAGSFDFEKTTFSSIADAIAVGPEGQPEGIPALVGKVGRVGIFVSPDFRIEKESVDPGQTVYEFLSKLASAHGLYAQPQTEGTLLFSKLDSTRAPVADLVEGESPLISIETSHDVTQRHYAYTVVQNNGDSNSATVYDFGVDNTLRWHKVVKPEQGSGDLNESAKFARSRGLIDSYSASATVTGWRHDGTLWTPGDIIRVLAPSAFIFTLSRLIIKRATMQLDTRGGEITQLDLALPELYDGSDVRGRPWAV